MEAKKKIPITFITGNKKKLEEFLSIMSEDLAAQYTVTSKEIDCKLSIYKYRSHSIKIINKHQ